MNLKKLFLNYCKKNELEINNNQITTIETINKFYLNNFDYNFFTSFFFKKKKHLRFLFTGGCWSWKNYDFKFFL